MKRQIAEELAFNFRSHGQVGRVDRARLSPAQAQLVARTAARTPEVMVKILSGGATSAKAVRRHLEYVGRKGEVELYTDDGDALKGRDAAGQLRDDWNLDLEEAGARRQIGRGTKAKPVRLAHKIVFSMPAGTSPDKVLSAVQNLCREEFALKHRYAMALHTDDAHPHVHVVLKARSEQGQRLNISKSRLKEWRVKFAAHLRELGVAANATPRKFRDQTVRSIPRALWHQRAHGQSAAERPRLRDWDSPTR
ncbi:MAG TPA: relaxase/mobilization nuclease domain-containing protein [Steroidobacteraceae bacterium]|nr:relaxase/mobilization nuclease domain-containing protein [Steroidobacteraceae bacterium]